MLDVLNHMGSYLSALGESCICLDPEPEDIAFQSVLPVYYVYDHTFTNEDLDAVIRSWNVICGGTGVKYQSLCNCNDFAFDDCVHWFFQTVIDHLLCKHPSVSSHFKIIDTRKHGYLFASVFGDILANINDSNEIHSTLISVALQQSRRGVHAIEYGIFGESLIHALKNCLGAEFTAYTETCWLKIISFILSVVVPVALAEDRKMLFDSISRHQYSNSTTSYRSRNE